MSDYLVVGTISSVIITFSLLFYFDITRKVDTSQSEVVGSVTFKRRVAQRKYAAQVVWEEVKQETPIYNHDAIRTADMSEAVIRLKDGTEISLDENSMILISLTGNELGIDFTQGSIEANRDNVSDASLKTLQIKSEKATVSIDKSDVKLTRDMGKDLSLTVNKGDATIDSGKGEQIVRKDQKVVASDDDIKVYELNITLLEPAPRQYFTISGDFRKMNFTWEEIKGPFDTFLEMSTDKYFEKETEKFKVTGTRLKGSISRGIYYWRIVAINKKTKKMELSETRRFTVLPDEPIQLIAPENNAVAFYRIKPPLITFKWSEDDVAASYLMRIARDINFDNLLSTSESNTPEITMFDLGTGTYYWKVDKISAVEGITLKGSSPVYSLKVSKKDEIEPPVLISPSENEKINALILQKKHIVFSWKQDNEIEGTSLYIARDKDFQQPVYNNDTSNNFLQLERAIPEGTYYWRVQGTLKDGEKTEYSLSRSFQITKDMKIKPIFALVITKLPSLKNLLPSHGCLPPVCTSHATGRMIQ